MTLRLRAVAELHTKQTLAARRDIAQMFRLRRSMGNDPILIAALVDSTCIGLLIQPVWEGLATRQWSADDLDAFRDSLQNINVLREYQIGILGEQTVMAARWPEDLQDMAQAKELIKVLPTMSGQEVDSSSLSLETMALENSALLTAPLV